MQGTHPHLRSARAPLVADEPDAARTRAAVRAEPGRRDERADPGAALEALAAGLVVAAVDGDIERVNRAAMDLLAIDEAERGGLRSVRDVLERAAVEWPDGRRVVIAETPFARARAGEAVRDVLLRFVPAGQPCRWVQASAVPLGAPGAIHHVAITFVDVTRTRELEQEQRSLVREMFDRLMPPIRTVREQARRIHGGAAGADDASAVARELSRAARRMEAAMREIEGALRVDSRALAASPELVDVKAFVLDLLERAAAEADVGRVVVSVPPGLRRAFVDPDHLERMLAELVAGALAGAAEGTDVLLACAAAEGGGIRITVASTRQDVPPEDLCHLFDRFHRSRGRPAGRLYLVRLLAEANRGRVLAESGQGRGLAISVELPAAPTS